MAGSGAWANDMLSFPAEATLTGFFSPALSFTRGNRRSHHRPAGEIRLRADPVSGYHYEVPQCLGQTGTILRMQVPCPRMPLHPIGGDGSRTLPPVESRGWRKGEVPDKLPASSSLTNPIRVHPYPPGRVFFPTGGCGCAAVHTTLWSIDFGAALSTHFKGLSNGEVHLITKLRKSVIDIELYTYVSTLVHP